MYKVRVMLSYFFSDSFSSSTLPEKNLNSRACPLGKQLSHFAHPRPVLDTVDVVIFQCILFQNC